MKKLITFVIVVVALVFVVIGCDEDGSTPVNTRNVSTERVWESFNDDSCCKSLEETSWRLSELVEVETGLQVEIEPKGWRERCQRCYTLKFGKEGAFSTYSSVNEYRGTYSEVKNGDSVICKISINISFGTKAYDLTGGDQMYERILEAVEYYELQKKELKLYYNENKNYLLFNSL